MKINSIYIVVFSYNYITVTCILSFTDSVINNNINMAIVINLCTIFMKKCLYKNYITNYMILEYNTIHNTIIITIYYQCINYNDK